MQVFELIVTVIILLTIGILIGLRVSALRYYDPQAEKMAERLRNYPKGGDQIGNVHD